jgi:hypothetical protein
MLVAAACGWTVAAALLLAALDRFLFSGSLRFNARTIAFYLYVSICSFLAIPFFALFNPCHCVNSK